jgi:hypothetical protein
LQSGWARDWKGWQRRLHNGSLTQLPQLLRQRLCCFGVRLGSANELLSFSLRFVESLRCGAQVLVGILESLVGLYNRPHEPDDECRQDCSSGVPDGVDHAP